MSKESDIGKLNPWKYAAGSKVKSVVIIKTFFCFPLCVKVRRTASIRKNRTLRKWTSRNQQMDRLRWELATSPPQDSHPWLHVVLKKLTLCLRRSADGTWRSDVAESATVPPNESSFVWSTPSTALSTGTWSTLPSRSFNRENPREQRGVSCTIWTSTASNISLKACSINVVWTEFIPRAKKVDNNLRGQWRRN